MSIPTISAPRGEMASRGSGCALFAIAITTRPVIGPECADAGKLISKRVVVAGRTCVGEDAEASPETARIDAPRSMSGVIILAVPPSRAVTVCLVDHFGVQSG